jgi:hypothetical protein
MSTIIGTHNLDLLSLTNPEIATFGNQSNEARIRFYDNSSVNGVGGYLVGMSNYRFSITKDGGQSTSVGIGTTLPFPNSTLHVQGTLLTSNIGTYGTDSNIYFNGQNLSGMNNINFTGGLYQNGSVFKTSQWLNTPYNDVMFPGNVAIGASGVNTFGSACNLLVVGNVFITGNISASNYVNPNAVVGIYKSWSLYNPAADGSQTITTNDPNPANCVLYSFNLSAGRYIVTATIPYRNLTPMMAIDSANWANIGLYQTTPSALTSSTPAIRFTQMTAIGSYLSTDIESVSFTWFLDISATNQPPYVIAVFGKGHQLQFGPAGYAASTLFTIPMRGIGYDDVISVRQALQLNPLRYTTTATTTGTNQVFTIPGTGGYYQATTQNVEFYLNGTKLANTNASYNNSYYISGSNYDMTGTIMSFNVTAAANITTNQIVDIVIWPQVSASSYYSSGFLYQQINTSTTPWMNVVSGGARLGSSAMIDGDLYVKGNIWGGCNTGLFTAGVQYTGTAPLNLAAGAIGTVNLSDGAVTASKLNLASNKTVAIGTATPNTNYVLDVYGLTHFANNLKCDSYLLTSYLGISGTPLSILGCTNPIYVSWPISAEGVAPTLSSTVTFQAPFPMNITNIKLPKFTLNSPAATTYTFNITVNGSTIYQTQPTITAGNTNNVAVANQGVLLSNPYTLNENSVIVASVVAPLGTGGTGAKVYIYST